GHAAIQRLLAHRLVRQPVGRVRNGVFRSTCHNRVYSRKFKASRHQHGGTETQSPDRRTSIKPQMHADSRRSENAFTLSAFICVNPRLHSAPFSIPYSPLLSRWIRLFASSPPCTLRVSVPPCLPLFSSLT